MVLLNLSEATFHKPFCSWECNRDHGEMVCLPAEPNLEPFCVMCGKPTKEWPAHAQERIRKTYAKDGT